MTELMRPRFDEWQLNAAGADVALFGNGGVWGRSCNVPDLATNGGYFRFAFQNPTFGKPYEVTPLA
ncbi:MAG: hypothetical protein V2I74_12520 [Erythrobacter sp.]|nr:hypothetical protein [Erythrobacter sp.]